MLAQKTKRISIPFSGYLSAQRFICILEMSFAVFFEQHLLQCTNILHLKTSIAFDDQLYWFGLLVLAGKVYL